MARSIEDGLAELRRLDVSSPGAVAALDKALTVGRPRCGLLVAAAATIVGEARLHALAEVLVEAFDKLAGAEELAKLDPGCRGKLAIARALHDLDHWDDGVFVRGLRIVQLECFDPDDTAAALRGLCGLAHAHFARHDALDVVAELLVDPQRNARIAAAQAVGDSGRPDGTALLRHHLLTGLEREPEVISACMQSLLSLARDPAIEFLVRMLDRVALAEEAALALGGARVASAAPALISWCDRCAGEQRRRVGFVALALLRTDEANAFLLDAMRTRARADAIAAAKALATFKDQPAILAALRAALADVGDATAKREIEALLE